MPARGLRWSSSCPHPKGLALWRRPPRIWPSACRRALRWRRALSLLRLLRKAPVDAHRCLSRRRSRSAAAVSPSWRPPGSSVTSCSIDSSVSGVDEAVDLYTELIACIDQSVEEVLTRGPLAVQQVGDLLTAVVAHYIGYELRHEAAERRPVRRCHLREVDRADLRQNIRRPRARNPQERPPVRSVEDADEPLILYFSNTLCDRWTRSWCSKQEPFTGA